MTSQIFVFVIFHKPVSVFKEHYRLMYFEISLLKNYAIKLKLGHGSLK